MTSSLYSVLSPRRRVKIGFLEKKIAACFAPLVDSKTVRLQAIITQKPAANSPVCTSSLLGLE